MMMTTTQQRGSPHSGMPPPQGFRSLLVPLDLTPSSDRVVGRLAWLRLAHDAQLTLLHVLPGSLTPRQLRSAERDARDALAAEARHLQQQISAQVRIELVVKAGAAAKTIAACATELRVDMVVMGRGSGHALRDTFLGSTAERVIRQARLPVLVVRLAPRGTYARPTLALNLDQAADGIVPLMTLVLPPPRPRVEVVHALEHPYQSLVARSLSEDDAQDLAGELRSDAAEELLAFLAAELAKANVRPEDGPRWKTHVRHGSARLVVEKSVKKRASDLLVVGTHAYSGAAHVFLGSVAGDVLRASKCDVLMVPRTPYSG